MWPLWVWKCCSRMLCCRLDTEDSRLHCCCRTAQTPQTPAQTLLPSTSTSTDTHNNLPDPVWQCYLTRSGSVTWPGPAVLPDPVRQCYLTQHGSVTWPCLAVLPDFWVLNTALSDHVILTSDLQQLQTVTSGRQNNSSKIQHQQWLPYQQTVQFAQNIIHRPGLHQICIHPLTQFCIAGK